MKIDRLKFSVPNSFLWFSVLLISGIQILFFLLDMLHGNVVIFFTLNNVIVFVLCLVGIIVNRKE